MDWETVVGVGGGIVGLIGGLSIIYMRFYMAAPERERTESNTIQSIADASESIATGAKVSNDFLRQQIAELLVMREGDIKERKEERLIIEKKLVERDARIQELEKVMESERKKSEQDRLEFAAWQDWAKRLSHQVISLGGIPVPLRKEEKK